MEVQGQNQRESVTSGQSLYRTGQREREPSNEVKEGG